MAAFVGAVLLVVVGNALVHQAARAQSQARVTCASDSAAQLGAADLPGLVEMGESASVTALPMGFGRNPAIAGAFVGGSAAGYVSAEALSGRYRAENDAAAEKLGYTPGQWPSLPLSGSIVSEVPGILEAFETTLVFDGPDGAKAYVAQIRGGLGNPYGVSINGQALNLKTLEDRPDEIVVDQPGAPGVERVIGSYRMVGSTIVNVTIRGGDISEVTARTTTNAAVSRIVSACGPG